MLKISRLILILVSFVTVSCGEEPSKTDTEKEAKELMEQLDREMEKTALENQSETTDSLNLQADSAMTKRSPEGDSL